MSRPVSILKICRLASLLIAACVSNAWADRITVFAAASLKPALDPIAERFEGATDHTVDIAYAGTSVLARQVQQGAPADVFVSANPAWMDLLEDQGLIHPDSRTDLVGNALVLISPSDEATEGERDLSEELFEGQRLAVALVEAVPAGIYARAALEALGIWDTVRENLVQTANVRIALALAARGEVPLAIVYRSDARSAPQDVAIVARIDPDLHPEILYPAAAIAGANAVVAEEFLAYLQSDGAQSEFLSAGFETLD